MQVVDRFQHREWFDVNWRPRWNRLILSASSTVGAPAAGGGGGGTGTGTGAGSPSPAGTGPAPVPAPTPGSPAASPAAPGALPVPPTGGPTGAPSSAADPNAANIEVLRQAHDLIKSLGGDSTAIKTSYETHTKLWSEAQELAKNLEYTTDSLQAAWKDDPVETLAALRNEAAQVATRAREAGKQIPDWAKETLAPIVNEFRQQKARQYNSAIDGELTRLYGEHPVFKEAASDPAVAEIRDFLFDVTREALKYDKASLQGVMKGDLTGVAKAFDKAQDRLFKTLNTYHTWQGRRSGAPAPAGAPAPGTGAVPGTKKVPGTDFSLQDLIEGNDKMNGVFQTVG